MPGGEGPSFLYRQAGNSSFAQDGPPYDGGHAHAPVSVSQVPKFAHGLLAEHPAAEALALAATRAAQGMMRVLC